MCTKQSALPSDNVMPSITSFHLVAAVRVCSLSILTVAIAFVLNTLFAMLTAHFLGGEMYRLRYAFVFLILSFLATHSPAQEKQPKRGTSVQTKDVDPLALDVLHAVAQPVEKAQSFNFKALVSEEELATNGQIVTLFHSVDITVQRPDKVHLVFRGRGQRVDFYGTSGNITMYAPDSGLYTAIPAKSTIDANLADLHEKGVDMAIGPFLSSNFYDHVAKGVTTGYVIGRVKIFDQDVHQLAFTSPDADWQVWVTGGETPRFVRSEVVNKKVEGKPRTIIQFLDWDLSPTVPADEFTFTKPADAREIGILPVTGGK
jgi:hypothetical protein